MKELPYGKGGPWLVLVVSVPVVLPLRGVFLAEGEPAFLCLCRALMVPAEASPHFLNQTSGVSTGREVHLV